MNLPWCVDTKHTLRHSSRVFTRDETDVDSVDVSDMVKCHIRRETQ